MNNLPIEQDIDSFAVWTKKMWFGDDDARDVLSDKDYNVMSLGLGGETGEVMEVIHSISSNYPIDKDWAKKELGDVLYYWARLGNAFNISLSNIIKEERGRLGFKNPLLKFDDVALGFYKTYDYTKDENGILKRTLFLGVSVGMVQEILKKRVRDGVFFIDKFEIAMVETIKAWCSLCIALDILPSQVISSNISKIEDRKRRGTMRGSGNNR